MLKKWIMPRGTGKTTQLIYEANNTDAVIVTFSMAGAKYINETAKRLNIEIKQPIPFEKFLIERKGRNDKYLIDELDVCLSYLDVVGYTNSSDE